MLTWLTLIHHLSKRGREECSIQRKLVLASSFVHSLVSKATHSIVNFYLNKISTQNWVSSCLNLSIYMTVQWFFKLDKERFIKYQNFWMWLEKFRNNQKYWDSFSLHFYWRETIVTDIIINIAFYVKLFWSYGLQVTIGGFIRAWNSYKLHLLRERDQKSFLNKKWTLNKQFLVQEVL